MTLGITGRSGCGKSTVTAVFAARGIPLADADQFSREILLPGSPLLPQLAERFGADIIKEDGDALTHPEIVRRIRAAKQAAQQAGAKLFVLDGAVIIGTAAEAECDKLCVVTAPFEVSVERIAARDGISPEMAARRLNAQTPEAVLTAKADYILPNTSTREALAKAANGLPGGRPAALPPQIQSAGGAVGRRIRARPAAGLCVHPHGERLRPRRHFQRGGPGADADDRGDLYLAAQQNCAG